MATTVRTLQNFIGGEWVDATGDSAREIVSPVTGEKLADAPNASPADVDRAVALGLIVNELVTNAFKHAFAASAGTLRVGLHPLPDGRWRLEVADDGSGPATASASGDGLGSRLVLGLANQLGGTVGVDHSDGYRVRVDFPAGGTAPEHAALWADA